MANDPLIPINTPFKYNIGINYESWENGRAGYSINADLNQITKYFGLIKTFHDVATGTANPSNPIIDATQQAVITYVARTGNLQLVMGTLNSALVQGGPGNWQPGLMTSAAYTDKWVDMIVGAFGSKKEVQTHLKMVLLANEIDQQGPPPTDPSFGAYQTWIQQSFTNLSASLKKAGLGAIPVSTTIANYGPGNAVAVDISAFIQKNWSTSWNGGKPIVLFNQYTQGPPSAPMSSTDYNPVIGYFESVYKQLNGKIEPFIGETGYSAFYGQSNQVKVYNQISKWLGGQYKQGGKTVPLFAFDAFDQPIRTPPFEVNFGIFSQNGSYRPTGLKPGLSLPTWSKTPISHKGNDRMLMFEGGFLPGMTIDASTGIDTLLLAEPMKVNFAGGTLVDVERLVGSADDDIVTLTGDQLAAFDAIDLGDGDDTLEVIVQGAIDFEPPLPGLAGIETVSLLGSGRVRLTLGQLGQLTAIDPDLDVVLADKRARIQELTPAEIGALGAKGVDRIDARGEALILSLNQVDALGPIDLTPADDISLDDTGASIAAGADFAALEEMRIDRIDATDGVLSLDLAQYRALGGVALAPDDMVTLADLGARLASLSIDGLASLAERGVDRLDATDDALALGADRFAALGGVVIATDDVLTLTGSAGDDLFRFARQSFSVADRISGGAGLDSLSLEGDAYASLAFAAGTIVDVERLLLAGGHDYGVSVDDANVGAGETLGIYGAQLEALDSLIFDGSAESDGRFNFIAGAGATRFTGGRGADDVVAGSGADTLRYTAAGQSTGAGHDTVSGFDSGEDRLDVGALVGVTDVDSPITGGALDKATFDADLAAAVAGLAARHAVLFTADAGTLAGATFLVVNANGVAGYQSGGDLVVRLDGVTGSIGLGNFS